VSAIIDGMGSIGAALGPMLTGYISDAGGFDMVSLRGEEARLCSRSLPNRLRGGGTQAQALAVM
jgi:hypothetical protein